MKAAAAELRTAPPADVGPAEVSAVIGALRELVWNVTTLTGVIAARYENIGALRHDHGDDPAVAVEMIGLRLGDAQGWLAQVDEALGFHLNPYKRPERASVPVWRALNRSDWPRRLQSLTVCDLTFGEAHFIPYKPCLEGVKLVRLLVCQP